MFKLTSLFGITAGFLLATPSYAAATYVGSFKGLVTSGGYDATDYNGCGCQISYDYTGQLVDINFKLELFSATEFDPAYYLGYGDVGNSNFDIFSEILYSPISSSYQFATFSGNERAGTAKFDYNNSYNNAIDNLYITYGGAKTKNGPVVGSGNAYSYRNDSFYGGYDSTTSISFKILSGSVQISGAPPAPEPATWAMMVIGFGAVGAVMRGRRKTRSAYNPVLA